MGQAFLETPVFFACLRVRRPRRLRRGASTPFTLIRLPGRLLSDPQVGTVRRLPDGFQPANSPGPAPAGRAAVGADELQVRAWLHYDQHGRADTTSAEAEARR
ncbi:hypothetical protein [Streptomyces sp. NBC_01766]|uniref:hypothetical protein n=1 Tax=Streptomyces sp. NBC_01766 TaxID=2975936 RepID=UPI002DDB0ECB|nr:hypothetical protein [Streptomyces sp. NBC_01766]WSC24947.1 hypothetical protein OIE60_35375 [Streptomyces sp. NBC_01766]